MNTNLSRLKKQILTLLKEDEEFRYAVAGLIGIEEILKRLDKHSEELTKLREDMNKAFEKHHEDIAKLWEEIGSLREGQNKLWEEVRSLREGQNKLWDETRRLRSYMVAGFGELRAALGVTYEMHAAAYVEAMLDELGYTGARVERKYIVLNGEVLDIDIFCERPLIIGELTISIRDVESAAREVEKLYERVNAVKTKYGKTPEMIILSVRSTTEDVANYLKRDIQE
ncbi:MAG: hypothetical protein QXT12_06780 [Nitrososphaerota archaeon]